MVNEMLVHIVSSEVFYNHQDMSVLYSGNHISAWTTRNVWKIYCNKPGELLRRTINRPKDVSSKKSLIKTLYCSSRMIYLNCNPYEGSYHQPNPLCTLGVALSQYPVASTVSKREHGRIVIVDIIEVFASQSL